MESHILGARVRVGPLLPAEGPGLGRRLSLAIRKVAPPNIVCESVSWDGQSSLLVDLDLQDVRLGPASTTEDYVAAVHVPAIALVRRAVQDWIPDPHRLDVGIVSSWLKVDAARIHRLGPPKRRVSLDVSWYRLAVEVTNLGQMSLEALAHGLARLLQDRTDIRASQAFAIPERGAIALVWEMEGFDEQEAGDAALFMAENLVSLATDDANEMEMRIVDLGLVRQPH